MDSKSSHLCVLSLGLALGLLWALSLFFLGLTAMWFGYGMEFVKSIGSLYIGYGPTWLGSLMGAVWGFFDLLICGILLAWFYNFFCKCCSKCGSSSSCCK